MPRGRALALEVPPDSTSTFWGDAIAHPRSYVVRIFARLFHMSLRVPLAWRWVATTAVVGWQLAAHAWCGRLPEDTGVCAARYLVIALLIVCPFEVTGYINQIVVELPSSIRGTPRGEPPGRPVPTAERAAPGSTACSPSSEVGPRPVSAVPCQT